MTDKKESLLSKKNLKLIKDPLDDNNPITVQVLGICSALAITVQLKPAVVMALSTFFVMCTANVVVSLMRNMIPSRIRIIIQLVVIATLVILVDQILKAFVYDVSRLSVFVGLIITNCIIMGRLEICIISTHHGNPHGRIRKLLDIPTINHCSVFRELLGGTLFGYPIIEKLGLYELGYENNGMMILPPMALVTCGIYIWIQRMRNKKLIEEN